MTRWETESANRVDGWAGHNRPDRAAGDQLVLEPLSEWVVHQEAEDPANVGEVVTETRVAWRCIEAFTVEVLHLAVPTADEKAMAQFRTLETAKRVVVGHAGRPPETINAAPTKLLDSGASVDVAHVGGIDGALRVWWKVRSWWVLILTVWIGLVRLRVAVGRRALLGGLPIRLLLRRGLSVCLGGIRRRGLVGGVTRLRDGVNCGHRVIAPGVARRGRGILWRAVGSWGSFVHLVDFGREWAGATMSSVKLGWAELRLPGGPDGVLTNASAVPGDDQLVPTPLRPAPRPHQRRTTPQPVRRYPSHQKRPSHLCGRRVPVHGRLADLLQLNFARRTRPPRSSSARHARRRRPPPPFRQVPLVLPTRPLPRACGG
eukprot:m.431880 g.431880  ORF g.431880 m.431880 type:complete len:374 (-) comp17364_c0_seq1:2769-3890(-)